MDIITIEQAKDQGLTHYFTGKPCLREHLSQRLVSSRTCCQCETARKQTAESRAQRAAHYKTNVEKVSEYRKANASKIAAQKASHYAANTAQILAQKAEYYKRNTEQVAARSAEHYKTNTERYAAQQAAYQKANRHIMNALAAKRRATKLQQTPSWADCEAIKAIYKQCAERTRTTGIPHAVDHIYPLISTEVCGLHVAANLQIITALENSRKNNRMPTPEQIPSDLE